jgi:hypothetical protein
MVEAGNSKEVRAPDQLSGHYRSPSSNGCALASRSVYCGRFHAAAIQPSLMRECYTWLSGAAPLTFIRYRSPVVPFADRELEYYG